MNLKSFQDLVYWFSHRLIHSLYRGIWSGNVSGLGNVPKDGPCILAVNHASHFDPPMIGCGIMRKITFFARNTLWKPGLASWWLDAVEAIPVNRDGDSDVAAMKGTLRTLKNNGILTLFPEGTRSKDGALQSAKPGIGLIAAKAQATVIPCRIFNSSRVLSRDSKFPNTRLSIHMKYGRPLTPADYDPGRSAGKQRYQIIADNIMAAIAKIEQPREQVI